MSNLIQIEIKKKKEIAQHSTRVYIFNANQASIHPTRVQKRKRKKKTKNTNTKKGRCYVIKNIASTACGDV